VAAMAAGSLLVRVWTEGPDGDWRVVARLMTWGEAGDIGPAEPAYATGVDDILAAVRDWMEKMTRPGDRL
jgi:hypothetical protein